jgi:hypothetical protein
MLRSALKGQRTMDTSMGLLPRDSRLVTASATSLSTLSSVSLYKK